ncbi:MAG: oligosaccharide flippase family protein [Elusimicrobia bacterium]|nr:oligosaccharide flippase family protein [Elusimicrobiota bacterium]
MTSGGVKKPDFHQDVLVTGLTEMGNMLVRFLASVMVARGLGAEGRGVYALALAAPGLLLGFTNIGLGEATTVLIGKGKYPRERVIASMNCLVLLIAVLGFAVYFGLSPLVMKALKHNMPADVYALAFCVFPLTLYWGGNASAALGLSMVKQVSWGRLLNNSVFLALVTVLYLRGAGIKAVLAAFIAALLTENVYLFGRVRRAAAVGLRWDPEMIREQAVLGWHVFWGGLFLQVTRRLDIFLLNYFAGPGPLGVYVVAYSVAEFILTVPGIYSRAAFSSAAVSSGEDAFRVSNAAVRQTLFLMAGLAVFLGVIMRVFISKVYGVEFLPAVLPALLLLPGVVLFGFGGLLGTIFTGYARPRELMRSAAVSCALTVALDLLLIPRYGAVGAAAASAAAYAAGALWILAAYLKFSRARASEVLLVGTEDFLAYRDRVRDFFKGGKT